MSAKREAEVLGVNEKATYFARQRVEPLKADFHPNEAISDGAYCYINRATRRDTAYPELLALMQQFWYTNDVSRASGNSADRDLWKVSKSPDDGRHPRP